MIFGIFGKFGIEIGTRKKIGRKIFRRKKSDNFWSKKNLGPKIFDFLTKNFSLKKSMKIQNFEISKNFRKKIEISKF